MIEKATYINHLGEEFLFGEGGVYLNCGGLRDFTWTATKKNNRLVTFDKGVVQSKLAVVIIAETEAVGIATRNRLFEIAEKDVLAMQPGKFVIGEYHLDCYITASVKSKYLTSGRYMSLTLTLQTDQPNWIKETTYGFYSGLMKRDYEYLDYEFDYDIDYMSDYPRFLRNTGFTDMDFRLVIYGACVNPAITIGEHLYQVNCAVQHGERLVIDSKKKTIVLIDSARNETNVFRLRNRNSYIFQKIPAGNAVVSYGGEFDFDVVLLEERSEPKWT